MIILDTCVLIFDALNPEKLSDKAINAIAKFEKKNQLYCADISLWEIGMLIERKRLSININKQEFITLILQARKIHTIRITPAIADIASTDNHFRHADPADRLIAASALTLQAPLVTCDTKISKIPNLKIIW